MQTWGVEPRGAQHCLVGCESPAMGIAAWGDTGGGAVAQHGLGKGVKPLLCFTLDFVVLPSFSYMHTNI